MSTCDRDSCCKGPVEREVGTPVAYVTEVHLVETTIQKGVCANGLCVVVGINATEKWNIWKRYLGITLVINLLRYE